MNAHVGEVDERGKFQPDDPQAFTDEFKRRKGRRVTVTVKEHRRRRTNPQNRYWWGVVVRMFSDKDALACSPEEAHEVLKAEVNSELKVIGERVIRIPRSTANLDSKEFGELVEKAQRLAVELYGIVIPDPGSDEAEHLIDERLEA